MASLPEVCSGLSVEPSSENRLACLTATVPLTDTSPKSLEVPGSMVKLVSSTLVGPAVSDSPLPSCLIVPCT